MVSIDLERVKEENIIALRELFESNQGKTPCFLKVRGESATRVYQSTRYLVDPTEQLVQGVQEVLGPNSIAFSSGAYDGR